MKRIGTYILSGFVLLSLLCSCVEKQDFDQYDDLQIEPVIEGSIIYVETPERIINEVTQTNFYSQDFNFDAFSEDLFAERVISGVITYEVENTTSKQLDITIEFLDDAGNVLDTENFQLDPAPTAVLQREIAYGGAGRSLDILRNTSGIRVSGENLGDNTSTSNLPDPKVTLKSSGKFTISLK